MFKYAFVLIGLVLCVTPLAAQTPERPFILPLQGDPGPNSWLFGQTYGNTIGAYNFGDAWYSAGQGLHFGLDFSAPCGTPVVAVADGYVEYVDDFSFGSRPHNLMIRHGALGYTSLYGHLQNRAVVDVGQTVGAGRGRRLYGRPGRNVRFAPAFAL
ncbi:M23 family metallopeptidase [bacterium]|nr:M23 family metallopeptidase [bacterium]